MDVFSFTCNLCQQTLELPKALKGKHGKCHHCQESVVFATETVDISKPFFVKRQGTCLGPFTMEEVEHYQLFDDDYVSQTYNGPWFLVTDISSLSTGKGGRKLPTPPKKERFARPLITSNVNNSLQPLFESEKSSPEEINAFKALEAETPTITVSTTVNEHASREVLTKEIIAPNLVCNFSLIFGPFFGAFLHAKNWRALEKPKAAAKTWYWAFAAYGIGWLVNLGFETNFVDNSNSARLGYLISIFLWYFAAGRPHVNYFERFNRGLQREGLSHNCIVVGIPAYAFLLFIVIAILLGFIVFSSL